AYSLSDHGLVAIDLASNPPVGHVLHIPDSDFGGRAFTDNLALSADGRIIAAALFGGVVSIYDRKSGNGVVVPFPGRPLAVRIGPAPDGSGLRAYIVVGHGATDASLEVLDANADSWSTFGNQINSIALPFNNAQLISMAIMQDGSRLFIGN